MTRWYREVWPWLLMLPPLLAVAGGVTMVILAVRTPGALAVSDYARIEELTSERFAQDAEAARLGLAASLAFGDTGIELRLTAPGGSPPATLLLYLQHATDAERDLQLSLARDGELFTSAAAIVPGRYRLELLPPDRSWRLASGILRPAGRIELRPQPAGS